MVRTNGFVAELEQHRICLQKPQKFTRPNPTRIYMYTIVGLYTWTSKSCFTAHSMRFTLYYRAAMKHLPKQAPTTQNSTEANRLFMLFENNRVIKLAVVSQSCCIASTIFLTSSVIFNYLLLPGRLAIC